MDVDEAISVLAADPGRTAIFTDFDGTLSEIVDRPEQAQPVAGAARVLEELARSFGLVGVVSGRSLDDLSSRLPVDGVLLAGSYGRERSDRASGRRAVEGWEPVAVAAAAMVADLDGVVVERKGAGVALHYRLAPELGEEVNRIAVVLAKEFDLEVLEGRLVAELVRPGPGKGAAVAALAADHDVSTLFIAGDDVADLEAFEWAHASPARAVLVGVASEEAPPRLTELVDLLVDGPRELVSFLRRLADAVAKPPG